MREATRYIVQEIGERFGGSDAEHRTAMYLAGRFRDLGLQTDMQRFNFIGWGIEQWPTLQILTPEQIEIEVAPLLYSGSTPSEGSTGSVVPRGVTFLIPGVMDMPVYDIVGENGDRLASLIVETSGHAIPLLNPRPMLRLPQVVIGSQDSRRIDRLLERGSVTARVSIQTHLVPEATAYNVICHATNPDAERCLVVSAHMDTTLNTPGAYDNAAGLGALIGLAKAVREVDTRYAVDLIAFACEEVGFWGSTYYVNDLKERRLLKRIRACINLDMISGGEELWVWAGPDDFRECLRSVLSRTEAAGRYPLHIGPSKAGADDWSFFVEGIPGASMLFWRQDVYHKPIDTLDKVDWRRVGDIIDATLAIIRGI